jgi:hypothetical protein
MTAADLKLNAAIARVSFMTNGKIGRDHYSGRPFVAHDKGSEWNALLDCLDAMREARAELASLRLNRTEGS